MFVHDLAEVVNRITAVSRTPVGESETAGWIAGIGNVGTISIRNIDPAQADRIQGQEDVASSQVRGSNIDDGWIRLIEDVEESGPELKLLRLRDVEVLEERDVEVAATRTADIERRLRWSTIRERRNLELAKVKYLGS